MRKENVRGLQELKEAQKFERKAHVTGRAAESADPLGWPRAVETLRAHAQAPRASEKLQKALLRFKNATDLLKFAADKAFFIRKR